MFSIRFGTQFNSDGGPNKKKKNEKEREKIKDRNKFRDANAESR